MKRFLTAAAILAGSPVVAVACDGMVAGVAVQRVVTRVRVRPALQSQFYMPPPVVMPQPMPAVQVAPAAVTTSQSATTSTTTTTKTTSSATSSYAEGPAVRVRAFTEPARIWGVRRPVWRR